MSHLSAILEVPRPVESPPIFIIYIPYIILIFEIVLSQFVCRPIAVLFICVTMAFDENASEGHLNHGDPWRDYPNLLIRHTHDAKWIISPWGTVVEAKKKLSRTRAVMMFTLVLLVMAHAEHVMELTLDFFSWSKRAVFSQSDALQLIVFGVQNKTLNCLAATCDLQCAALWWATRTRSCNDDTPPHCAHPCLTLGLVLFTSSSFTEHAVHPVCTRSLSKN